LSIYPNPAFNEITIETGEMDDKADVIVSDLFGKEVSKAQISKGSISTKLDISDVQNGCYFITISLGGRTITRTFVKM
jgi:hypothetical protein